MCAGNLSPSAEARSKGKKRRKEPPAEKVKDGEEEPKGIYLCYIINKSFNQRTQMGGSGHSGHNLRCRTRMLRIGWMRVSDSNTALSLQLTLSNSGDRVQWFRAEAEMERWREEWEVKQADFLRCIRSFGKMADVWQKLSAGASKPEGCSRASEPGRTAYANQKSAMFRDMERHAKTTFRNAGYGELIDQLLDQQAGKILADFVLAERSDPKYQIPELVALEVSSILLSDQVFID
jgi:hypothetical protein